MVINSAGYLLFLMIISIAYYIFPPKYQNYILLIANAVFYLLCAPRFFLLIAVTTVASYLFGRLLSSVKRNRAFAAIYFALYASYFGTALYNVYINCTETGFNIVNSSDLLCTFFGVLLPLLTFLDVFFNKNRGLGHGAHREDGFYANEKYDRKFDERADRNQYRT
jgi:hypothetical protein